MTNSLKSDFLRAISTAGIKPPQNVVIDGQIHRFSTNDKIGDNAGWYVLKNHGDFTFGVIAPGTFLFCILPVPLPYPVLAYVSPRFTQQLP